MYHNAILFTLCGLATLIMCGLMFIYLQLGMKGLRLFCVNKIMEIINLVLSPLGIIFSCSIIACFVACYPPIQDYFHIVLACMICLGAIVGLCYLFYKWIHKNYKMAKHGIKVHFGELWK